MKSMRDNLTFRLVALVLTLCFAGFAFHFLAHLGHVCEGKLHTCPVCQALAFFAFIVALAFVARVLRVVSSWREPLLFLSYQNPSFSFRSNRAPPFLV